MTEQAFMVGVTMGFLLQIAVKGLWWCIEMATDASRRRRGLPPATRRQRDRAARAARLRIPSDEQRGVPPARDDFDNKERC